VLCFQALSRHLGADQPFHGLQSRGLAAGEEPCASIEEMAAAYRTEIVRAAAGPYYLGGWSLGGAVAFELARQLAAAGEEIALLAIVDATPGAWPRSPAAGEQGAGAASVGADGGGGENGGNDDADDARWLMDIADYLQRLWGVDLGLSHDDLAALPPDGQARRFLAALEGSAAAAAGKDAPIAPFAPSAAVGAAGLEQLRRLLRVFKANVRAFRLYRPEPYPGPITLFRPAAVAAGEAEDAAAAADPLLGWGALSPRPVDLERVPGDHISVMAEPHVQTLAGRLRAAIVQAAERRL
jgi:thioesterase domain-containing protein